MRERGWLIDLYETTFRVDLPAVLRGLAEIAELDADALREALAPHSPQLTLGAVGWREVFPQVLEALGRPASEDLVDQLVAADRHLLLEHTRVFDDALALLSRLRETGARTAFVSNCAEHTRELLGDLGLDGLVDELVLSCEVSSAKPDRRIFEVACDRIEVPPHEAVLVDDQAAYCAGAIRSGLRAVQVRRGARAGGESSPWPVYGALTTSPSQRAGDWTGVHRTPPSRSSRRSCRVHNVAPRAVVFCVPAHVVCADASFPRCRRLSR